MAFSLRLSDSESQLIRDYAKFHDISISGLFRQAVIEKIEDEYDLNAYEKAMAAYKLDNTTYSLGEVEKELGIN